MKQNEDQSRRHKTRPVPGHPEILELVDAYRPVHSVGGPFVMRDHGPNGGREAPRMTKPIPLHPGSLLTNSAGSKSPPNSADVRTGVKPGKRPRSG